MFFKIISIMQKLTLSIIALIMFNLSFGQSKIVIPLEGNDRIISKEVSNNGFTIQMSFSKLELKEKHTPIGNFVTISQNLLNNVYTEGLPNIPILSRLIEIPQNAKVTFEIVHYDEQIIKLSDFDINYKIVPATRSQSKNEQEVPYLLNESVYNQDAYFNPEIAKFVETGQLRAARIGNLEISPLQYNPVTNTLRVLNNIEIAVHFQDADQTSTRNLKEKYTNHYEMNNGSFFNKLEYGTKELIQQAPTHLVIVSHRMFESQLAPFIAWKVKKGFHVTVAYTDVIGTTTTAIKTYLQGIYQSANPMSFVLLVGDVAQVPAWTGVSDNAHVTDLYYADYTSDNIPDVYYGRFSAQTAAQLQPQIDKTLMYEQYTMPDPTYLSNVLLVAGDDSGHEMTWGNGQLWYGQNYFFNASNNTNTTTYLQPLDNAAIHTQIINRVNAGLSFSNYTAHCSSDGWAEPSFSISDVNGLTNVNKYGFMVGNCCLSSKFDEPICFGEAILRKSNGGVIGYIGASNSSYWDEDYWWGVGNTSSIVAQPTYTDSGRGVYDGYWHTQANESNNTNTWYITGSQMIVNGNLAVQSSTSPRKLYYWEIYHLMGDPSVVPYIGMPQAMSVVANPSTLMIGMTSVQVTAAPYSYVALSQNGVLIAAALANVSGIATLNFASNALSVGNADIVITAQNRVPYISTITVSPANEPYITLQSYSNNVPPVYGQNVSLNVTLENVAALGSGYDANGVVATISTTDSFVTISDNTQAYGQILAGNSITQDNSYSFTIANNVPDEHIATFNMVITDTNGHTWNAVMNYTLRAPEFTILNLSVNDASGNNDGILDPGETADLLIQTTNTGHAFVSNVIGNLTDDNSYLTINSATTSPIAMDIDVTADFIFNVTASADTPAGTLVNFNCIITGASENQYTNNKDFQLVIGFVPGYCTAGADFTNDEFISSVQFNSIDVSSTQGPSYTDNTNISTTVYRGQAYTLTVTNGEHWSNDQMQTWIDWNYDGDFDDANETINMTYTGTGGAGSGTGTGVASITIPNDAHIGNNRMRIRVMYSGTLSPCGNSSYGEVEDYTLNVQSSLGIEDFEYAIGLYPNPNDGSFIVNISDVFVKDISFVDVYNSLGQLVYNASIHKNNTQITLNNAKGLYIVKIAIGDKVAFKKIIVNP